MICNACRSSNVRRVAVLTSERDGQRYNAMRCQNCGLVFADPLPRVTTDLYDESYTEGQRTIDARSEALLWQATQRQMELVERYVRPGLALNVGAMSSASRVLISRGWQLKVIDVSRYAVKTARDLWGYDAMISRIEDYDAPPETFDFIKLGHVIEHLTDPAAALCRLARMLKPGGVILIDTDNANGIKALLETSIRSILGEQLAGALVKRFTGKNLHKRYGRLTPPEHLYSFTPRSLEFLVENAGLEAEWIKTASWGDKMWFPIADRSTFGLAERLMLRVGQAGAWVGLGDVVAVLARKAS